MRANQAILWKWRTNRVNGWMLKDPATNISEKSEFFRSIVDQDLRRRGKRPNIIRAFKMNPYLITKTRHFFLYI